MYKIKFHPDGTVERYKTRIHQLNVNNAFLHGDLVEEVYMKVPPGFARPGDTRVCRLRKSIYGLRQASHNWYQKFTHALQELQFVPSRDDHSLIVYRQGANYVASLTYADDVILAGNDLPFIRHVKDFLHSWFTIKDLGPLKYFLDIEVARSPQCIVLNQWKYVLDILVDSALQATRPTATLIEENHQLGRAPLDPAPDSATYRHLVGRLLYLTVTRPDITYAVNVLSQAVHSPHAGAYGCCIPLSAYLKASPSCGLFLPASGSLIFTRYCDADWVGCPTTWRSTTGYFITIEYVGVATGRRDVT
ncbi:unnamed protein product [Linum trigynum]|uniref:Reverse transcriptase Ty1/copia-type domain-containing protein n=1 Tax=Linum trigynum TaxID=586398 RepID=A0AAV2DRC1_9ROSI